MNGLPRYGVRRCLASSITIAALALAACGGPATAPSRSSAAGVTPPSPSEEASPSQTVAPTASATASVRGLPPDSLARVVTNDLVVRSLPEISDRSTIDPDYLQDGQLLFVLEGPLVADGYEWYRVAPFDPSRDDIPNEPAPLHGWVAAGSKDGEPWINPTTEECAFVDPEANPYWYPSLLALACFGDREVAIGGTVGGCTGTTLATVEPDWLVDATCGFIPTGFVAPDLGPGSLPFHIPPDGPRMYGPEATVRIVGHLDDPAAQRCRAVNTDIVEPLPPEIVVLYCRAAFVVTEVALRHE